MREPFSSRIVHDKTLSGQRPRFQGLLRSPHQRGALSEPVRPRRVAPSGKRPARAGPPDVRRGLSPRPNSGSDSTARPCRGVNRPLASRAQPKTFPVGRTVLIRGENRRDSRFSRGENRLNY